MLPPRLFSPTLPDHPLDAGLPRFSFPSPSCLLFCRRSCVEGYFQAICRRHLPANQRLAADLIGDLTAKKKMTNGENHMTGPMRALLVGAALSGFVAGATATAQTRSDEGKTTKNDSGKRTLKSRTEKHACKGQNSCKGKGGCQTGDNGCNGKNSCKGKGGCATLRWYRLHGAATF